MHPASHASRASHSHAPKVSCQPHIADVLQVIVKDAARVWVAALLVAGCTAYPTGAPASVCNEPLLAPTGHINIFGATGVNNTDQYTLSSQPVADSPGIFKVTLSGPVFKGFVVRATTPNEKKLGEFLADADASDFSVMACASQEDVGVTHVSAQAKSSITLFWVDRNNGNYVFQATVVPDTSTFVTNIFEQ